MTLKTDIQKLEPGAVVELFELDLTGLGGTVQRFHAGTNSLLANVTWAGNVYTAFPVQASGFEWSGQGTAPRPRLVVANVAGSITALVLQYDDIVGAKLTRIRTLAKYLDPVNFPGGTNPSADPSAEFPRDVFYVDRKSSETNEVVEFELAPAMDVTGVKLPRRQIVQNLCPWKYRGTECGYVVGPVPVITGATYVTTIGSISGWSTITKTAHGVTVGQKYWFQPTSGASLASPQDVWNVIDANTFQISAYFGQVAGSGSCNLTQYLDANDAPVYVAGSDVCGKRLSSCKARFGTYAELPFGGFPAAGLIR